MHDYSLHIRIVICEYNRTLLKCDEDIIMWGELVIPIGFDGPRLDTYDMNGKLIKVYFNFINSIQTSKCYNIENKIEKKYRKY